MVSGRDSRPDDLIDLVFDVGTSYYNKAQDLASNLGHNTLKTVQILKDTVKFDGVEPLHTDDVGLGVGGSGVLGGVYDMFYTNPSRYLPGIKKHWMLSTSVVASGILLGYGLKQALTIPTSISRNETQVILILGDYSDPIIRSQALDFYRRNYMVFICSENVDRFKIQEEDFENLYFINPQLNDDLFKFTKLFDGTTTGGDKFKGQNKLASIIFTPNLSYFTPGEVSLETLQYEIRSNILINYNTLLKILPHLPRNQKTQLILLNPSLSYNLQNSHHPAEMFISGFITSIYRSLKNYESLNIFMIHIGLFQVRGQLSNYKYLKWTGSDINVYLHDPIYKLIRKYNGNLIQRLIQRISTFNGYWKIYYMGRYSLLATFNCFPIILKLESVYFHCLKFLRYYTKMIISKIV